MPTTWSLYFSNGTCPLLPLTPSIVDCFEIKIETPSHLVAKSAMWSQYKHSNTAKVFIAMCPQGITSFVS